MRSVMFVPAGACVSRGQRRGARAETAAKSARRMCAPSRVCCAATIAWAKGGMEESEGRAEELDADPDARLVTDAYFRAARVAVEHCLSVAVPRARLTPAGLDELAQLLAHNGEAADEGVADQCECLALMAQSLARSDSSNAKSARSRPSDSVVVIDAELVRRCYVPLRLRSARLARALFLHSDDTPYVLREALLALRRTKRADEVLLELWRTLRTAVVLRACSASGLTPDSDEVRGETELRDIRDLTAISSWAKNLETSRLFALMQCVLTAHENLCLTKRLDEPAETETLLDAVASLCETAHAETKIKRSMRGLRIFQSIPYVAELSRAADLALALAIDTGTGTGTGNGTGSGNAARSDEASAPSGKPTHAQSAADSARDISRVCNVFQLHPPDPTRIRFLTSPDRP
mmetsp:Transcript_11346/g.30577  ORF Transcript_11346/g.30577 Transcript_11346/m.30577 type:complete len:408 (+) Transcript_11346:62-1285(+)